MSDFVNYLNDGQKRCFSSKPVYLEGRNGTTSCFNAAFQYTDGYTENIFSYVNNIPTAEGGTHETGFKARLHQGVERLCPPHRAR